MVSGVSVVLDAAALRLLMKANITQRGARWSKTDLFLGQGEEQKEGTKVPQSSSRPNCHWCSFFFHYALLPNVATASQGPNLRIINTLAFWRIFLRTLVESVDFPGFLLLLLLQWRNLGLCGPARYLKLHPLGVSILERGWWVRIPPSLRVVQIGMSRF